MPEKINWTLNVQVVGGPKISASQTITVDAYDKIQVSIEAGANKAVEVQPGPAGRVQFLLINSDQFGDDETPDKTLTYRVNDAGVDETIELDAQQLLMGDGAVGLLDAASGEGPETLHFTNGLDKPVNIEILVGRNVAPPIS